MKRCSSSLIALALLLALLNTEAVGQNENRRGIPNYDPKTEVTTRGVIQDVQQQTGRQGWSGTHLTLKSDAETLDVHVGPSSYIAQQQFSFAKGDAIEVVGSRVTIADKEALIAREITKDGKTLVLRNTQGIPQWSGGRSRNN